MALNVRDFETPVVSLILGGRLTCRLMAFPARVLVYRHISRLPGADVPGAFASKLGRGEIKAWPRGESHSPPISARTRALFNSVLDIDRSTLARAMG
jgi:hypothetical protein